MNIIKFSTRILSARKLIKTNKKFLTSGKYEFIGDGKQIFFLSNFKTTNFIERSHEDYLESKGFKKMIKNVIYNLLHFKLVNEEPSPFIGEMLMITGNYDIKVFNFDKKLILNLIKDENIYIVVKKAYDSFNSYFDIPAISWSSESKSYIEKLIDFESPSHWLASERERLKILHNLFEKYEKYFNNYDKDSIKLQKNRDLFLQFENLIQDKEIIDNVYYILKQANIIDEMMPKILLHGDMHFHNILKSYNVEYIIDWEYSNQYIFFYDLLNLIYVEFVARDNYSFFTSYMSGNYDRYFLNYFKCFSMKFDESARKSYFMIFIMERAIKMKNQSKNYSDEFKSNHFLSFINEVINFVLVD